MHQLCRRFWRRKIAETPFPLHISGRVICLLQPATVELIIIMKLEGERRWGKRVAFVDDDIIDKEPTTDWAGKKYCVADETRRMCSRCHGFECIGIFFCEYRLVTTECVWRCGFDCKTHARRVFRYGKHSWTTSGANKCTKDNEEMWCDMRFDVAQKSWMLNAGDASACKCCELCDTKAKNFLTNKN